MSKKNDYVGRVFERLSVIKDGGRDKRSNVLWLCSCICGGNTLAHAYDLRKGKIKSCGCYNRDKRANKTHGFASSGKRRSKVYSLWSSMVQRCTNPKDKNWYNYGGRGITICESWTRFEGFLADMGDKPEGLTLDRRDNNAGYDKNNCRWVTQMEQSKNTRSNVWVTIGDKTQILADWIRELHSSGAAVHYIMKKGLTHEEAIKRIFSKRQDQKDF